MIAIDTRLFDTPGRPWPLFGDKPCLCMNCPECRGYVMDVRANRDFERDTSGWKPSPKDLLEQIVAMTGDADSSWGEEGEEGEVFSREKTYLRTYDDMRLSSESKQDLEGRMLAMAKRAEEKVRAAAQRAEERLAAQSDGRAKRAEERLSKMTQTKLERKTERRQRKMMDMEAKVKRMEDMLASIRSEQ